MILETTPHRKEFLRNLITEIEEEIPIIRILTIPGPLLLLSLQNTTKNPNMNSAKTDKETPALLSLNKIVNSNNHNHNNLGPVHHKNNHIPHHTLIPIKEGLNTIINIKEGIRVSIKKPTIQLQVEEADLVIILKNLVLECPGITQEILTSRELLVITTSIELMSV